LINRRLILSSLAAAATLPRPGWAADYPARAIRVVVPFPAGSTTDAMARFLGDKVSKELGQTVVVDNRPGAQGGIAASEVARAKPDGYTLFAGTNSTQAANVHLFEKLSYDPQADFAGITRFAINPLVLVVRADFPATNLEQFLQLARSRSGGLNFGVGNTGSLVTVAKLMTMTNFSAVAINYAGSPQAVNDLLGGRLDFMITDVSVTRAHLEAGKLRALGVTTGHRLAVLPSVPTLAEAGVKGYEFSAWGGLFAPAKTPRPIVEQLSKAFAAAITSADGRAFFEKQGQVGAPMAPDAFDRYVVQETEIWGRLLAQANVKKQ
jgi:tripartite-type tricarboxylate transporter receptor subunit TctC